MNNVDKEYFRILNLILEKGRWKNNRTGIKTLSIFGEQAKFDLSDGFPILTTKKVFFKGVVHELLWFIKGDTNIKYLVDNDVHIWDGDCYRRYKETPKSELWKGDLVFEFPSMTIGDQFIPASEMKFPHSLECDATPYSQARHATKDEFIQEIKNDKYFAKRWGELGEGTYGGQWTAFPYAIPTGETDINGEEMATMGYVNQLQKVIDKLKTNPDDRRMIVSAWHPYWVDHCALPPCHVLFQFHTEKLDGKERLDLALKLYEEKNKSAYPHSILIGGNSSFLPTGPVTDRDYHIEINRLFSDLNVPKHRLNCLLYQRSCDTFLGVPFNISSYSLLTCMIAHVVNMVPGTFIHSMGDLHIYENHISQVKEQLSREPKELPKLWLNPKVNSLFDFKYDDVKLIGYDPHPTIKAEVAV